MSIAPNPCLFIPASRLLVFYWLCLMWPKMQIPDLPLLRFYTYVCFVLLCFLFDLPRPERPCKKQPGSCFISSAKHWKKGLFLLDQTATELFFLSSCTGLAWCPVVRSLDLLLWKRKYQLCLLPWGDRDEKRGHFCSFGVQEAPPLWMWPMTCPWGSHLSLNRTLPWDRIYT